ncbi:MAG TPA: bifunctional pyr operon transcriptional regulator/uracil phosphoribosyltransferase PyrR [Cytophagaceae bacterium]
MNRRIIIDQQLFNIIIDRMCQEVLENHQDFSESVILGIQPRGVFLAERITATLKSLLSKDIKLGYLDVTFYRDDFRKKEMPLKANATKVPFLIEDKNVILVDDVLYTGRTVRAAMDAMIAFGRPRKVELLALVDRKYSRDLPIQGNYVGTEVNCLESEKVWVELKEQGIESDNIWLINKKN